MPKLTVLGIKAAGPGLHADIHGLYLRVSPSGARSWVFRYQRSGKRHMMGLGSTAVLGLREAREEAARLRLVLRAGRDPMAERSRPSGMTFREVADMFLASHEAGWRNVKHRQQWRNTLSTYVFPTMGDAPVTSIGVGEVMLVLDPIWREKPETASRVRGRIEAILDFAAAREWRQGENPARWRGHLKKLLPEKTKVRRVRHHPALPYGEVPGFMRELREQPGVAARALEFAILTAARTSEALGMTWTEVDIEKVLWTVPAERIKAGREHRVPLSGPALAIIEARPRLGPYVFQRAGRPLSNMALLMLLRRMGRSAITTHGFRSSFRDWAAETTGFPHEVCEMALAHAVGDKVEAAYRRGDLYDKRRYADVGGLCSVLSANREDLGLTASKAPI